MLRISYARLGQHVVMDNDIMPVVVWHYTYVLGVNPDSIDYTGLARDLFENEDCEDHKRKLANLLLTTPGDVIVYSDLTSYNVDARGKVTHRRSTH